MAVVVQKVGLLEMTMVQKMVDQVVVVEKVTPLVVLELVVKEMLVVTIRHQIQGMLVLAVVVLVVLVRILKLIAQVMVEQDYKHHLHLEIQHLNLDQMVEV